MSVSLLSGRGIFLCGEVAVRLLRKQLPFEPRILGIHAGEYVKLVFLCAILGTMLWDMQRQNRKAHAHTQEILRDIARFLGTDRR